MKDMRSLIAKWNALDRKSNVLDYERAKLCLETLKSHGGDVGSFKAFLTTRLRQEVGTAEKHVRMAMALDVGTAEKHVRMAMALDVVTDRKTWATIGWAGVLKLVRIDGCPECVASREERERREEANPS